MPTARMIAMTSRSVEAGKVWWAGFIPTCPRCLAGVGREGDSWCCLWCGYSETIDEDVLTQLISSARSAAGVGGQVDS